MTETLTPPTKVGYLGAIMPQKGRNLIDFSAAMGYESVLVDALWDTQIGREKIAVKLKLSLPMFAAGSQLKVYSDTPALEGSLNSVKLSKKQQIQVPIPCNGGVVITQ